MDWLDRLTGKTLLLAIAIGSAFVGLVVNTEIKTFRQRISYFIGGALISYFLTGPAIRYLEIREQEYISLIAFSLGVFGMSLLQRLKVYVDSMDIIAVIRARVFPGAK